MEQLTITIYNIIIQIFGGTTITTGQLYNIAMSADPNGICARCSIMFIISMIWLLVIKTPALLLSKFGKTTDTSVLTWTDKIDKVLMVVAIIFIVAPIIPMFAIAGV